MRPQPSQAKEGATGRDDTGPDGKGMDFRSGFGRGQWPMSMAPIAPMLLTKVSLASRGE